MPAINQDLSHKLRRVSLFSILMIVVIHARNVGIIPHEASHRLSAVTLFVQEFISDWVTRSGTPLFMTISGYLFFFEFAPRLRVFAQKLRKRLLTLAVPFAFWSLWGILLYAVLQTVPAAAPYFKRPFIRELSPLQLWNLFFWMPPAYPLWFLRDLLLLVLISPLLHAALRRSWGWLWVVGVGVLWCLNCDDWWKVRAEGVYLLKMKSLFFFSLGGFFAIHRGEPLLERWRLRARTTPALLGACAVWFGCCAAGTWLAMQPWLRQETVTTDNPEWWGLITAAPNQWLFKSQMLAGMLAIWFGHDRLLPWIARPSVDFLKQFTFFLYVSHEPLERLVLKVCLKVTGYRDLPLMGAYLATILVVLTLCVSTAAFTKRFLPRLYYVMSGGR